MSRKAGPVEGKNPTLRDAPMGVKKKKTEVTKWRGWSGVKWDWSGVKWGGVEVVHRSMANGNGARKKHLDVKETRTI